MASLSATRGKLHDRLAELHTVERVAERLFNRRLGNADGARRGLDARRFERRHQLLEAEAFDAAKQIFGLHPEAVERDLVFLHAAIAEHLDLGARHAGRGKRIGVGAARLFRQQHREAAIALLRRIGAHQQRHQIGAHRMRDPGLVAVHLVGVALAHRAGLQRREIGAGIRLGEHRRRQHFAGCDLRQPLALLVFGAAAENKLGRDLGAGAETADADIAARQFLGDDAHRFLAEPHAAVILGDGEAEHAELGHLRDDIQRDVFVAQVPFLRVRHDLAVGELAHLLADRSSVSSSPVAPTVASWRSPHQFGEPGAVRRGVAVGDQMLDRGRHPRGDRGGAQPEIGRDARSRPGSSECRR